MMKIVPSFEKIFKDFDTDLPAMTQVLITASNYRRQLLVSAARHPHRHLAVDQTDPQVPGRPLWAGTCSS